MERWFLGGAVLALLILLFDKPLAEEIISETQHVPMAAPQAPTPVIVQANGCNKNSQDSSHTAQGPLSSLPAVRSPDGFTQVQQFGNALNYGNVGTVLMGSAPVR